MTPVFCCGFECGVSSTAGSHWDNSTEATFSTSTVRSGARSLRMNLTASSATMGSNYGVPVAFGGTAGVLRGYIRFTTLPDTNFPLLLLTTGSTHQVGLVYQSSDGKLYAGRDNNGTLTVGASGFTPVTGQWYQVDIRVNVAANPWLVDVQIDGTALGQASIALAASTISIIRCGRNYSGVHTTTVDCFIDDILMSSTLADYPLGPGYVNHFVPTADGAHNIAGTADFRRTLTATDILNSTTDAHLLVDEVPLEATVTDWINMIAPPNATDYVECIFGPAPGIEVPVVGPRTVEVICGINQAGTGAGNMEIRLNDNGSMGTIYTATGVAGVAVATGQQFKRAHFADPPSAASAWNVNNDGGNGDFRDLRIRFGSPAALDVNPDQYFGCAMIEAEFAMELPRSSYGSRPMGPPGQNQMNQLLIQ